MFLLDTNVVSGLRRRSRADAALVRWARVTPLPMLYLSVVSTMEIELGVLRAEHRDPRQGATLRQWFETDVLRKFEERILPIDEAVARQCARINASGPKSINDSYIAATAIVRNMTVVTRNESDFRPTGVAIFNPWVA